MTRVISDLFSTALVYCSVLHAYLRATLNYLTDLQNLLYSSTAKDCNHSG